VRAQGSARPERLLPQLPRGATLVPGLHGGQPAGGSVEHRGQQLLGQARATESLRRHHFRLQTTDHLPGESTGVCLAREASASRSVGATLVPGLCDGRSAGESVEHRGQQLLERARATEPLRQRHFRLQTTGHLPGQSIGVRPAREASASCSSGATLVPGLHGK
jgi:hypothetical protein